VRQSNAAGSFLFALDEKQFNGNTDAHSKDAECQYEQHDFPLPLKILPV